MLNAKTGPRIRPAQDSLAPYETISIDKLTPVIGAMIGGVDLSRSLSNRQLDEIHRALCENLVVFFRDQRMSGESLLALGRAFGELHVHPAAPHVEGMPELMKIHTDVHSPRANGDPPIPAPIIRWSAPIP